MYLGSALMFTLEFDKTEDCRLYNMWVVSKQFNKKVDRLTYEKVRCKNNLSSFIDMLKRLEKMKSENYVLIGNIKDNIRRYNNEFNTIKLEENFLNALRIRLVAIHDKIEACKSSLAIGSCIEPEVPLADYHSEPMIQFEGKYIIPTQVKINTVKYLFSNRRRVINRNSHYNKIH